MKRRHAAHLVAADITGVDGRPGPEWATRQRSRGTLAEACWPCTSPPYRYSYRNKGLPPIRGNPEPHNLKTMSLTDADAGGRRQAKLLGALAEGVRLFE